MTLLALLRHAPTEWNRTGRMQGRADVSLLDESRADLARLALPAPLADFRVLSSPLRRCLETAAGLGLVASPDARLIEMDWGRSEGRTLAELRATYGAAFAANEASGLDFRPDGGESPRDVQARIVPLMAEIARRRQPTLAITHRGVIRAVYAQATGWNMVGPPPDELDPQAVHLFRLDPNGRPTVDRLNIPLVRR